MHTSTGIALQTVRTSVEFSHTWDAACEQPFLALHVLRINGSTLDAAHIVLYMLSPQNFEDGTAHAEGAEPMEVDAADGELQGPEQLAALRGGVFWLDPPSSQSQASEHQQQQRQQRPSTEQQQRGGSKGGGVDAEGAQKADSSAAVAQTSDGAKQAEGSFMYGGGGGSVLLFDAGVPCPRAAWLLPRHAPPLALII